ncbi:hypothetical protein L5515_010875 [Caenorhabditis briggsae]|uniref:BZIP domain-containing protein n=1 Tax=Caenorhabditis briggsae TaxID=6238 RepID=A0AAE9ET41_CAEBR|nr:hypothetical protein L5515_010875 [Caenorhabditis briggsae]
MSLPSDFAASLFNQGSTKEDKDKEPQKLIDMYLQMFQQPIEHHAHHQHQYYSGVSSTFDRVFPQSDYMTVTAQNNTPEAITSNGTFEHAYGLPPISPLSLDFTSRSTTGRQQQTQTSPASATVTAVATQGILEYEGQRNSFSDSTTDSSSPCSGMSSPSYDHESRFYGKLLPHRENFFDRSSTPSRNGAVATKINRVVSSGQRKRGRQSKDEQLASEHSLPVTAHQISEMSLSDLQNVLKMGGLSEYQKQLIRKIRRRGKNKVAARTCRQRRTDRHDKQTNMNHYI